LTVWLVLGGVVWCLAAVALAVVIGRAVAQRDRQRPRPEDPAVQLPTQQKVRIKAPGTRPGPGHSLASRLLRRR
jgi:hypothetical protein